MAGKRHHLIDYAEDSYTDEDDDIEMELELDKKLDVSGRPRPGRPRKTSLTTNSSIETTATPGGGGGVGQVRRRGRGPSKRPCLNRNALMARENRQRKKEYIERIESRLQFYQKENQELNNTIQKQSIEIKRLSNEVAYLKTVLNNNTMITSLLKSMNNSLRKMHSNDDANANPNTNATTAAIATATSAKGLAKPSADILNWVVSGQTSSSKTNNLSVPISGSAMKGSSEITRDDSRRVNFGQSNNTVKIARKTMPFTNFGLPKTENPSSVESYLEEEGQNLVQKSSPESGSYCEYNMDKSSAVLDNQLPTTPMSTMSNSMDKGEASLSDTDFSQLSSFNVDLFDNFDKIDEVANPLQFEQETPDIFNEETLFHSLEKDTGILNNDIIDPLEISKMSDALNEKTLFHSLENTGVCLHINSSRVSLEYCSICHLNSLNSEIV